MVQQGQKVKSMAQSTYTYELTEEQQNLLLLIMEGGNYRKRTVP